MMGMDLSGRNGVEFRYSLGGWEKLYDGLIERGVDVSELKWSNDGDMISEATCLAIADALERSRTEEPPVNPEDEVFGPDPYPEQYRAGWISGLDRQIAFWRNCGGCAQW